jgi:hypothetical protein
MFILYYLRIFSFAIDFILVLCYNYDGLIFWEGCDNEQKYKKSRFNNAFALRPVSFLGRYTEMQPSLRRY